MRRTILAMAAISSFTLLTAGAYAADAGTALTPDAMTWKEMSAKAPGVQIANVKGDYTQGAWAGFIKFPPGSKSSLHTHSSDLKIVMVSGTFRYGPTSDKEQPYGPGSYLVIPRDAPHTNSQPDGCVMYVEQDGKFDNKAAAPAASK